MSQVTGARIFGLVTEHAHTFLRSGLWKRPRALSNLEQPVMTSFSTIFCVCSFICCHFGSFVKKMKKDQFAQMEKTCFCFQLFFFHFLVKVKLLKVVIFCRGSEVVLKKSNVSFSNVNYYFVRKLSFLLSLLYFFPNS